MFKSCSSKWKQQLLVNKPNMKIRLGGGKPNFIKSDFRDFFFQLLGDFKSNHILSVDAANKQTRMRAFPYRMSTACVSDKVHANSGTPLTVEKISYDEKQACSQRGSCSTRDIGDSVKCDVNTLRLFPDAPLSFQLPSWY